MCLLLFSKIESIIGGSSIQSIGILKVFNYIIEKFLKFHSGLPKVHGPPIESIVEKFFIQIRAADI